MMHLNNNLTSSPKKNMEKWSSNPSFMEKSKQLRKRFPVPDKTNKLLNKCVGKI